ncbi:MAG: hypothetical protein ABIN36_11035 [Ferruginibacter sp.]
MQYNRGFTIHDNNPFIGDVREMSKLVKKWNRTFNAEGLSKTEELSITYKREYFPLTFTKVFHNKETLNGLSAWACKILVYISVNLEFNLQKIKLNPELVGLDARMFSRSIKELISKRIVIKEKRQSYWINITLLVVGNVNPVKAISK